MGIPDVRETNDTHLEIVRGSSKQWLRSFLGSFLWWHLNRETRVVSWKGPPRLAQYPGY
jgi:hypothetical protein